MTLRVENLSSHERHGLVEADRDVLRSVRQNHTIGRFGARHDSMRERASRCNNQHEERQDKKQYVPERPTGHDRC